LRLIQQGIKINLLWPYQSENTQLKDKAKEEPRLLLGKLLHPFVLNVIKKPYHIVFVPIVVNTKEDKS
jgi:hypothetical protein